MKALGQWIAETRAGRLAFRLVVLGLAALLVYIGVNVEVSRQTQSITRRVAVIEQVGPADVIRECLRTPKCRHLLAEHPKLPRRTERGDASQPAPAGQQPAPPAGGTTGQGKPPKGGSGHGKAPQHHPGHTQPAPTPAPSPTPAPAPQPEPTPSPLPPQASPNAQPPGLLDPALSKVCSVADRAAHLCTS